MSWAFSHRSHSFSFVPFDHSVLCQCFPSSTNSHAHVLRNCIRRQSELICILERLASQADGSVQESGDLVRIPFQVRWFLLVAELVDCDSR